MWVDVDRWIQAAEYVRDQKRKEVWPLADQAKPESARATIAKWVAEEIGDKSEYNCSQIQTAILGRLRQPAHKTLVTSLMQETIEATVYEIVQRRIANSRDHSILLDDGTVTPARKLQLKNRWQKWIEHVGERHMRLLEMTRDDLLAAAVEREKRGNTELRTAKLWRLLAEEMPAGKKLGECATIEEIESLHNEVVGKENAA